MKTIKTIKLLALFVVSSIIFTACSDDHDHDDHDHDEELITTVIYTLTDGATTITLEWEDLDGDSGDAPVITSGILSANTIYTGAIQLLNRTETPAEDITTEVRTEGDEHEFFYSTDISGTSITKTDLDANNNPLGISTTLTTGSAGAGTMTIVLRHEPTKPNNGLSTAGGSTDVEVTFPITVQ